MGSKRRLRNPRQTSMDEAFWLALNQLRRDAAGNKINGPTFEEILAMGPEEFRRFADGVVAYRQQLEQDRRKA